MLFVELKKTLSTNRKKAFQQLRWSLPLLEYLGSICELHFGLEPDESEKEVKDILICDRIGHRIDKQSVKAVRSPYPEQYKDIIATEYTADLSMIAPAVQDVVDKIAGSGSVS